MGTLADKVQTKMTTYIVLNLTVERKFFFWINKRFDASRACSQLCRFVHDISETNSYLYFRQTYLSQRSTEVNIDSDTAK